ncbi:hypothetical protein [Bacillus pseudomycoides]|uniref:hypothetical protein n=1 Tax=Bacillus pseudomycoides TaxID=64104 RepID=UPI000BED19B1|nr:hypothetical protein [Bacillus pseudomycoides]PDY48760.1 hypothetical protein CON79_02515 [Bacillus pseudomycoides]PEA81336.1 hypothetical protein CON99_23460 [Bacillus pseudomycoides]PED06399.1 hypothetical protein COO19_21365 [Bacillus pseudomycoides]PED72645.1 hypothetical protein CON97_07480 [Bacillus pseudomycoides]PEI39829.1 hypothetical protein CN620_17785 [Bacillus pseudomycoides]
MEGLNFSKMGFEMIDLEESLDFGFEDIVDLSRRCKFSNCTHTNEPHCAVKKAISDGTLCEDTFNGYYRNKNEAEYVSKQKNNTKAVDYMKQLKLFQKP